MPEEPPSWRFITLEADERKIKPSMHPPQKPLAGDPEKNRIGVCFPKGQTRVNVRNVKTRGTEKPVKS